MQMSSNSASSTTKIQQLCCGRDTNQKKIDRNHIMFCIRLYLLNHDSAPNFDLSGRGNVMDLFISHCDINDLYDSIPIIRQLPMFILEKNNLVAQMKEQHQALMKEKFDYIANHIQEFMLFVLSSINRIEKLCSVILKYRDILKRLKDSLPSFLNQSQTLYICHTDQARSKSGLTTCAISNTIRGISKQATFEERQSFIQSHQWYQNENVSIGLIDEMNNIMNFWSSNIKLMMNAITPVQQNDEMDQDPVGVAAVATVIQIDPDNFQLLEDIQQKCRCCMEQVNTIYENPAANNVLIAISSIHSKLKCVLNDDQNICQPCFNTCVNFANGLLVEETSLYSYYMNPKQTNDTWRYELFQYITSALLKSGFIRIKSILRFCESLPGVPDSLLGTQRHRLIALLQQFCTKITNVNFISSTAALKHHPNIKNLQDGYIHFTGLHCNVSYANRESREAVMKDLVEYIIKELNKYAQHNKLLYESNPNSLNEISFQEIAEKIIPEEMPTLYMMIRFIIDYAKVNKNKKLQITEANIKLPIVTIAHSLLKILHYRLHLPMHFAYGLFVKYQSNSTAMHIQHAIGLSNSRSVLNKSINKMIKDNKPIIDESWCSIAKWKTYKEQVDFYLEFETNEKLYQYLNDNNLQFTLDIFAIQMDNLEQSIKSETSAHKNTVSRTLLLCFIIKTRIKHENPLQFLRELRDNDYKFSETSLFEEALEIFGKPKGSADALDSNELTSEMRIAKDFYMEYVKTILSNQSEAEINESKLESATTIIRSADVDSGRAISKNITLKFIKIIPQKVGKIDEVIETLELCLDKTKEVWDGINGNYLIIGVDGQVFDIISNLKSSARIQYPNFDFIWVMLGVWHQLAKEACAVINEMHPEIMEYLSKLYNSFPGLSDNIVQTRDISEQWRSMDRLIKFGVELFIRLLLNHYKAWLVKKNLTDVSLDNYQQWISFLTFLDHPLISQFLMDGIHYMIGMDGIRDSIPEKIKSSKLYFDVLYFITNKFNYTKFALLEECQHSILDGFFKDIIESLWSVSETDMTAGHSLGNDEILEFGNLLINTLFPGLKVDRINDMFSIIDIIKVLKKRTTNEIAFVKINKDSDKQHVATAYAPTSRHRENAHIARIKYLMKHPETNQLKHFFDYLVDRVNNPQLNLPPIFLNMTNISSNILIEYKNAFPKAIQVMKNGIADMRILFKQWKRLTLNNNSATLRNSLTNDPNTTSTSISTVMTQPSTSASVSGVLPTRLLPYNLFNAVKQKHMTGPSSSIRTMRKSDKLEKAMENKAKNADIRKQGYTTKQLCSILKILLANQNRVSTESPCIESIGSIYFNSDNDTITTLDPIRMTITLLGSLKLFNQYETQGLGSTSSASANEITVKPRTFEKSTDGPHIHKMFDSYYTTLDLLLAKKLVKATIPKANASINFCNNKSINSICYYLMKEIAEILYHNPLIKFISISSSSYDKLLGATNTFYNDISKDINIGSPPNQNPTVNTNNSELTVAKLTELLKYTDFIEQILLTLKDKFDLIVNDLPKCLREAIQADIEITLDGIATITFETSPSRVNYPLFTNQLNDGLVFSIHTFQQPTDGGESIPSLINERNDLQSICDSSALRITSLVMDRYETITVNNSMNQNILVCSHSPFTLLGLLLQLYQYKDCSDKPIVVFQYDTNWSIAINSEFWNSFETWEIAPNTMSLEYRINLFVIINLIYSNPFSPSFSFLNKKVNLLNGVNQLHLAVKHLHEHEQLEENFFVSHEQVICNKYAIKNILIVLIIQANRGTSLSSEAINYTDFFINTNDTIKTEMEIDEFLRSQLNQWLSAFTLPGEDGLSLHAHRIQLFFERLLITSKSRSLNKFVSDAHELQYPKMNTVRLVVTPEGLIHDALAITGLELLAIPNDRDFMYFIRKCKCKRVCTNTCPCYNFRLVEDTDIAICCHLCTKNIIIESEELKKLLNIKTKNSNRKRQRTSSTVLFGASISNTAQESASSSSVEMSFDDRINNDDDDENDNNDNDMDIAEDQSIIGVHKLSQEERVLAYVSNTTITGYVDDNHLEGDDVFVHDTVLGPMAMEIELPIETVPLNVDDAEYVYTEEEEATPFLKLDEDAESESYDEEEEEEEDGDDDNEEEEEDDNDYYVDNEETKDDQNNMSVDD